MDFEGIYCFDTATVRFAIYPDGPDGVRIVGEISEDTLHDVFGAREVGDMLLEVCKTYLDAIQGAAIACYRANPRRPITLTIDDFPTRRNLSPLQQADAAATEMSA